MSARQPTPPTLSKSIAARIETIDWPRVSQDLDAQGSAIIDRLISEDECQTLAELYPNDDVFRSRVVMTQHGFGRGEYKYFRYPLPEMVGALRTAIYPHLVPVANRWNEQMGQETRYPEKHADFIQRCHGAGQVRPTPLLLRYGAGDYNCLHQDLYGEHVFPLQVTILLSHPGKDFTGGEFVMTEQRPRMQSRPMVVPVCLGDAVVFAVYHRPVQGARGIYRVNLRHGVSRLRSDIDALSASSFTTPSETAPMNLNLFSDKVAAEEAVGAGATLLRQFTMAEEAALLSGLWSVVARSPFRHMITPGGFTMSVGMSNCGSLGWVTDRKGYRYDAFDPITGSPWPPMPESFLRLAVTAAARAGFDQYVPDACLINRFAPGAKMSLHQDKNERDFDQPIVSVSLGIPAIFLFGGLNRADKTIRVQMTHGDVIVWGGPARLFYHGVLPLKENYHSLLGGYRINLTFRKAA